VTPAEASSIARAVKEGDTTIEMVGVFVNTPASEVNNIADFYGLDRVQLSGDESWEYCRKIDKPIIKAFRVGQQRSEEICAELTAGAGILSPKKFITLLDSEVEGEYGGTGMKFNWEIAQQVAQRFPIIIAGGLEPDNVAEAIETVSPWGVDVSSGVEVEGVKDAAKIRAFIEAVRRADENKK
jgi:phosphoribosylanthranilate isomerase